MWGNIRHSVIICMILGLTMLKICNKIWGNTNIYCHFPWKFHFIHQEFSVLMVNSKIFLLNLKLFQKWWTNPQIKVFLNDGTYADIFRYLDKWKLIWASEFGISCIQQAWKESSSVRFFLIVTTYQAACRG